MKVSFQNQPRSDSTTWLGNQLRGILRGEEGSFDIFLASVAYAKLSGVSRLIKVLKVFQELGGKTKISIGVNQGITSYQALETLLGVVDDLYVFHDSNNSHSFHPKIYLFEKTGVKAIAIIGSGNLTGGGLFSNYEGNIRIDLDLSVDAGPDNILYTDICRSILAYQDTRSPLVKKVSKEVLKYLRPCFSDESKSDLEESSATGGRATANVSRLLAGSFGTEHIQAPPPPDISIQKSKKTQRYTKREGAPLITPSAGKLPKGLWKMLSRFDTSRTSAPGQIQIPMQFRGFFPPQRMIKGPDAGGVGRTWETYFPVVYADSRGKKNVPEARFIVYEPKVNHPRPNTECRFTFQNKAIREQLSPRDILEFICGKDGVVQEVRLVPSGTPRHKVLSKNGKIKWGMIY